MITTQRNESLEEYTISFLTDSNTENIAITAINYKSYIIEILSLLSNPKVSEILPSNTVGHIGPFLKNLYTYLDLVQINSDEIQTYCDNFNIQIVQEE